MRRIGVGIVGARGIGAAHVAALRSMADVEVRAVAGSTLGSAKQMAAALQVPRAVEGFADLLTDPDIDVVHVCTPNESHARIAGAAIDHGKHVVCEKPLAHGLDEGESLVARASTGTSVAVLAYNYRYLPLVGRLRQLVEDGVLGRVHAVRGTYLQNWMLPPRPDDWRADPARGGLSRVLADIGTHLMDLTEVVTGATITAAAADFTSLRSTMLPGQDDQAGLLMRLSNGAGAALYVSQVAAAHRNRLSLAVDGDLGSAIWSFDGREHLRHIQAACPPAEMSAEVGIGDVGTGRCWMSESSGDAGRARLLAAAYAQMGATPHGVSRPPVPPINDVPLPRFADGVRHLRVIESTSASFFRSQLQQLAPPHTGPEPTGITS